MVKDICLTQRQASLEKGFEGLIETLKKSFDDGETEVYLRFPGTTESEAMARVQEWFALREFVSPTGKKIEYTTIEVLRASLRQRGYQTTWEHGGDLSLEIIRLIRTSE